MQKLKRKEDSSLQTIEEDEPHQQIYGVRLSSTFLAKTLWLACGGDQETALIPLKKENIDFVYKRISVLVGNKNKKGSVRFLLKLISALVCYRLISINKSERNLIEND